MRSMDFSDHFEVTGYTAPTNFREVGVVMENYNSLATKIENKCLYHERKNRIQNSDVWQYYEHGFSFFLKPNTFSSTTIKWMT